MSPSTFSTYESFCEFKIYHFVIVNLFSITYWLFSSSKHKILLFCCPRLRTSLSHLRLRQATGVCSLLPACDWSAGLSSRSHWSALVLHCSDSDSGPQSESGSGSVTVSSLSEPEVNCCNGLQWTRGEDYIWRKIVKMLTAIDSGDPGLADGERHGRKWRET